MNQRSKLNPWLFVLSPKSYKPRPVTKPQPQINNQNSIDEFVWDESSYSHPTYECLLTISPLLIQWSWLVESQAMGDLPIFYCHMPLGVASMSTVEVSCIKVPLDTGCIASTVLLLVTPETQSTLQKLCIHQIQIFCTVDYCDFSNLPLLMLWDVGQHL